MPADIAIDSSLCTRCGACVRDCPARAMTLSGGHRPPPPTIDSKCFGCGHCGASCAVGAVSSSDGEFELLQDATLSPAQAKAWLSSRRSVRHYRPAPVAQQRLLEALSVAPYAPTASHAQDVHATLVAGDQVFTLASAINDYYLSFERLLNRRWLWPVLWLTAARPYLKHPERIASIRRKAKRFDRSHDWIFFHAPAVVILSAPRRNRRFGQVNCVIAAERIMQYAAALGLGSCWIGYAEVALKRRRSMALSLGIRPELTPQSVFTLGEPEVQYHRLPARRPIRVTFGVFLNEVHSNTSSTFVDSGHAIVSVAVSFSPAGLPS